MPKKADRLRSLFAQFQGTKAAKEEAWVENAVIISGYVDKAGSIDQIKQDFSAGLDSPAYKSFEEPWKKRSMGALLYGKLALDDYLQSLKEGPEKQLLGEISETLGALYRDGAGNKDKLLPLLSKVNQWLDDHAANSNNKDEALVLTKGLYTMLSCLKIKMGNLPSVVTYIAGDLIDTAKTEIPLLMTKVENQARTLEVDLAEIAKANAGKEKSMQDLFNDRYLEILNKPGDDQITTLDKLKSTAVQSTVDIQSLLSKRQEAIQLEEHIVKLQTLMRSANENDTRVTGRKYFQELVTANQDNYDLLLKAHPDQTKIQELEALRTAINQESGGLKTGAMYLGSVLTSPLSLFARSITPKFMADMASGIAPDTNDSLAKRNLIEMTRGALDNLQGQLKTKNEEISDLEVNLAADNETLQSMIEEATPEALQEIITTNTLAVEMAEEYNRVREPIDALGEKLKKIEQLDSEIGVFIRKNDNFLAKVGDWFSRFGDWFSTPSLSEKIKEAKNFKKDLIQHKAAHNDLLQDQMKKFDEDPAISGPVKARIKQQLEERVTEATAAPSSKQHADQFKAFKHDMQALKPVSAPAVEVTPVMGPGIKGYH